MSVAPNPRQLWAQWAHVRQRTRVRLGTGPLDAHTAAPSAGRWRMQASVAAAAYRVMCSWCVGPDKAPSDRPICRPVQDGPKWDDVKSTEQELFVMMTTDGTTALSVPSLTILRCHQHEFVFDKVTGQRGAKITQANFGSGWDCEDHVFKSLFRPNAKNCPVPLKRLKRRQHLG